MSQKFTEPTQKSREGRKKKQLHPEIKGGKERKAVSLAAVFRPKLLNRAECGTLAQAGKSTAGAEGQVLLGCSWPAVGLHSFLSTNAVAG